MDFTEIVTSPAVAAMVISSTIGWVVVTWLRVRHGYPLEGGWGQSERPVHHPEVNERIRLLTAENAQMAAELSAMKERLVILERIATDSGSRLAQEIDRLKH